VVVVPSYRLSPLVKHPNHCEDIACALKFTAKNIEKYGGDANMVLLMGHSAGGHIISLITLYPQFLTKVGLEPSFIKGVVSVSGVYDISAIAKESKVVLRMIVNPAFGVKDDLDYSDASPIEHITPNSPPFLILNAQNDWGLEHQAKHFHEKLKNAGVECEWKHYEGSNTNHLSIIGLGKSLGQPYREMMRDSIKFFQTIVARTSNDFIQDEETVDSIVQDIPINQEQEDDAESESLEVGLMEDGDMAM
jgi:acetyl esterase/lipase